MPVLIALQLKIMSISGYLMKGKIFSQLTSPLLFLEGFITAVISAGSLSITVGFWRRRSCLCACVSQIQQLDATPPEGFVQIIVFLCVAGAIWILNVYNITYAYVTTAQQENVPQWLVVVFGVSVGHSMAALPFPFLAYVVYAKIIYHQFATLSNVLEEYLSSDRFLQGRGQGARPAIDGVIDLNAIYASYAKLRLLYEELWSAMFLPVLANNVVVLTLCVGVAYNIFHVSAWGVDFRTAIDTVVSFMMILAIYCQGHVADMVSKEVRTQNI